MLIIFGHSIVASYIREGQLLASKRVSDPNKSCLENMSEKQLCFGIDFFNALIPQVIFRAELFIRWHHDNNRVRWFHEEQLWQRLVG